jgi:D-alanine--D-alanine ligase
MNRIPIAVVAGGPSHAHGISVASGKEISHALRKKGYSTSMVYVDVFGNWSRDITSLKEERAVAFLTMRGKYGEDGVVQRMLREQGIPFTGSDVLQAASVMHKGSFSRLLPLLGYRTPHTIEVHRHHMWPSFENIAFPVVIKPAYTGSSIGISYIEREEDASGAILDAFRYSKTVLVQEYIRGREVSVGVFGINTSTSFTLPPVKVISNTDTLCDHPAKYAPRGAEYQLLEEAFGHDYHRVSEAALKLHDHIGATGLTRTDMILADDGELYILEINTVPDVTATSSIRKALHYQGMDFADLLELQIQEALSK